MICPNNVFFIIYKKAAAIQSYCKQNRKWQQPEMLLSLFHKPSQRQLLLQPADKDICQRCQQNPA